MFLLFFIFKSIPDTLIFLKVRKEGQMLAQGFPVRTKPPESFHLSCTASRATGRVGVQCCPDLRRDRIKLSLPAGTNHPPMPTTVTRFSHTRLQRDSGTMTRNKGLFPLGCVRRVCSSISRGNTSKDSRASMALLFSPSR